MRLAGLVDDRSRDYTEKSLSDKEHMYEQMQKGGAEHDPVWYGRLESHYRR